MDVEFRKSYWQQDQGTIRNISLSGAFLEKDSLYFNPGDKIQMVLNVESRTQIKRRGYLEM